MQRPRYYRRRKTTNPNEIDRINEVKRQICLLINKYGILYQLNRQQLADRMETSLSCTSKVLNNKYEVLTLSQLFKYLAKIHPRFKILIASS